MTKELYVSSSPHETKVAVLEDDQLVEVWFERDVDVGIVGVIRTDMPRFSAPLATMKYISSLNESRPPKQISTGCRRSWLTGERMK